MIGPAQNPLLNANPQDETPNQAHTTPAADAPWASVNPQTTPDANQPFQPIQPAASSLKSHKPIHIVLPTVAILVVAIGAVFAANSLSKGQEAKVGSDYLKALQTKDAAAIEGLVSPEVSNLGNKVGQLGGASAKTDFYKSVIQANAKEAGIGSGDVEEVSVTTQSGDAKYAYATYKVGSKPVTVLETYQDGKPKVLEAKSGVNTYTDSKFNANYKTTKEQMDSMGTLVGEIAQGAGSDSPKVIQSLFSTN